jgi:hypothetical protein
LWLSESLVFNYIKYKYILGLPAQPLLSHNVNYGRVGGGGTLLTHNELTFFLPGDVSDIHMISLQDEVSIV